MKCDRCRTGRGNVVDEYYTVAKADFAMIAAVDAHGRVVLVHQYKHGAGRVVTELPAGHIHRGETPVRAAARELEEETGRRAGRLRRLGVLYCSPAVLTNRAFLFLATHLTRGTQRFDHGEDIAVRSATFGQALRSVNEICSVSGLLLAREALNRERKHGGRT